MQQPNPLGPESLCGKYACMDCQYFLLRFKNQFRGTHCRPLPAAWHLLCVRLQDDECSVLRARLRSPDVLCVSCILKCNLLDLIPVWGDGKSFQ